MDGEININIIGNGLLARSFEGKFFSKKYLILASGVSDSKETRQSEFLREAELIRYQINVNPDSTVIYFSTCSVGGQECSLYIQHKLNMESLVANMSSSFHIFRLPQVVGFVRNKTIVSFFVNAIINGKSLKIQRFAERNLIDVSDVSRIVMYLIESEMGINSIQNIASRMAVPVIDIASEIADILSLKLTYLYEESGDKYDINIDFLKSCLNKNDSILHGEYWRYVLQKYVPLYISINK